MNGKSADTLYFISKLTFLRIFNAILIYKSYWFSYLFKKPFYFGRPLSASIEATTQCNLQCPECPSGQKKFSRPTGSIELHDFLNYVNQLHKELVYLMIYFQGEPYMNKSFFEMVKYACSKKIYTSTSTNGHFLDNENARQTVLSGLDRIIISFDGSDQQSYAEYRIGGNFEKVKEGIKNLVQIKKKLNSRRPYIILQSLMLHSNEEKIIELKNIAKDLQVNELQFKTAQFYNYRHGNPLMPDNLAYSRYIKNPDGEYSLKKKTRNRCLRMWQSLVITWDGKVIPCCFDKDAGHPLGDLKKDLLKNVLKSPVYRAFRESILKNRKDIEICNNCTE